MLNGVSFGWPAVLSSLKSFLETGKPFTALVTPVRKPAAVPA